MSMMSKFILSTAISHLFFLAYPLFTLIAPMSRADVLSKQAIRGDAL